MRLRPILSCAWILAVCCTPACSFDFDAPFEKSYWATVDAAADAAEAGTIDAETSAEADGHSDAEAGEGGACSSGQKRCEDRCVQLDDPAYGCAPGVCEPCALPNAIAACSDGACDVASCLPSFGDCNGVAVDGCEQSLRTLEHCGACNNPCVLGAGEPTCATGECVVNTCAPNTADCNGNPADGCETFVLTDTEHCGGCGASCSFDQVTGRSCSSGLCAPTCMDNWGDCDGPASGMNDNGCETFFGSDVYNCGGCGNACPPPASGAATGSAVCSGGMCGVSCQPLLDTCPSASGNVCVSVGSDPQFCGSSCTACSEGATCNGGGCAKGSCSPGLTDCGTCVNTMTNGDHCGGCYIGCGGWCSNGSCQGSCGPGETACSTGCSNLLTDPANCGTCGFACTAGQVCAGGFCAPFVYASGCWECGLGNPYPTCCFSSVGLVCLPSSFPCP